MNGTPWPDVLADLTAKRDALDQVIETIRTHFMNGNSPNAERPRKRTDGRTDGRTEQSARQVGRRIGASLDEEGAAILAQLKAHGPMNPRALAKALKVGRAVVTYRIRPLIKSGAVVATGSTMNRQFSLPPRSKAAKEAP